MRIGLIGVPMSRFYAQKTSIIIMCCLASSVSAASFDCGKASTPTETTICYDAELSAMDDLMGETYKRSFETAGWMTGTQIKESQKEWLALRNACGDNPDCIYGAYADRISDLAESVGKFDAKTSETSFIYLGEPSGGTCSEGTLNDYGQCVELFPGGASFRGFGTLGKMAFSYFYVGANGHMCSASGAAQKNGNTWDYVDMDSACRLSIEIGADGIALNPTEECNYYCGMRAQGAMSEVIKF